MKRQLFRSAATAILVAGSIGGQAQNLATYDWVVPSGTTGGTYTMNSVLPANNKVYGIGTFSGSITFGSTTITSAGGTDIYVVRYSAAGAFEALARYGGTGNDDGRALAFMSAFGNGLVICGSTSGQILVQSLSPGFANNSVIPAQTWSSGAGIATGMAKDAGNRLNVCGSFYNSSITFGTATLTTGTHYTTFVARLSSYSPITWETAIQPDSDTDDNEAYGIIYNWTVNKLYITGYYKGTMHFHATSYLMTASGSRDIYIQGINYSPLSWSQDEQRRGGSSATETAGSAGVLQRDIGWTIAADANGIYVGGRAGGSITFYGSASNTLTLSSGSPLGYVVAYNFNAQNLLNNPVWGSRLTQIGTSTYPPAVYSLACDGIGNVYMTGECNNKTQVEDPTNASNNISLERSNPQFACGFIGAYATSNGARLWTDRLSETYTNATFSGIAYGRRVAYSGCKLYVSGDIVHGVRFGNMATVGANSQYRHFFGALEPMLQINTNLSTCLPTGSFPYTIQLTAATQFGGTLNWAAPISATGSPVSVTYNSNGSYTYTVSTTGGTCPAMNGTVTVYINELGAANAGSDQVLCVGTQIGTAAQPGCTYSWTGPGGFTSSLAQPILSPPGNLTGTYTLTVTDGCGNVTTDYVVLNPDNSGVCRSANPNGHQFEIFPNPSNGYFNIRFETEINRQIIVCDLNGRVVFSQTTDNGNVSLDLSQEPAGIYSVKIVGDTQVVVRQLVKQ